MKYQTMLWLAISMLLLQQIVILFGLLILTDSSWSDALYDTCWAALVISFVATQLIYKCRRIK
jgi:hypothetical protein